MSIFTQRYLSDLMDCINTIISFEYGLWNDKRTEYEESEARRVIANLFEDLPQIAKIYSPEKIRTIENIVDISPKKIESYLTKIKNAYEENKGCPKDLFEELKKYKSKINDLYKLV